MAILWKTKQALVNCVAKGSLAYKASLLSGSNLLIGVETLEVSPQKAVEVDGADPTRDTYQRKVFFDGTNFFIVYWDLGDKKVYYVASASGKSWTSRTMLMEFSVAPYFGGNVDLNYPSLGTLNYWNEAGDFGICYSGSNGVTSNWNPVSISARVLTQLSGGSLGGLTLAQGGRLCCNLNGVRDYMTFHRTLTVGGINRVLLHRSLAIQDDVVDDTLAHGGSVSGGSGVYSYKSSSPFNMLCIVKAGDNILYSTIITLTGVAGSFGTFTPIGPTLGNGFSDWCATSEVEAEEDPECVHLVYIKSTGELCYRKFEDNAWGSETELVASGASYPVIAAGKGGRLYVFYVKDAVIKLMKYDGSTWGTEATLFSEHTYDNPTYLSSNQNVQKGQICLVWTEKTSSPYEVWFCTMGD